MSDHQTIEITDDNYSNEALGSPTPILLDFWAAWCAPCRAIAPHVEAIARAHGGRIRVGKIDIDANPEIAARFDVRSIPTLLMLDGGRVVGQIVGAVPRARIEQLVQRALPPGDQAETRPSIAGR
jgi:thioredoxin 1